MILEKHENIRKREQSDQCLLYIERNKTFIPYLMKLVRAEGSLQEATVPLVAVQQVV